MRTNRRVQFHRTIAIGAQALRFQILFFGHSRLEPRPKSMVAHLYFHLAQPIRAAAQTVDNNHAHSLPMRLHANLK